MLYANAKQQVKIDKKLHCDRCHICIGKDYLETTAYKVDGLTVCSWCKRAIERGKELTNPAATIIMREDEDYPNTPEESHRHWADWARRLLGRTMTSVNTGN